MFIYFPNKEPVSRFDYFQCLLSSQINYTLTNFADHSQWFSHDQLNSFLRNEKLKPRLVWKQIKDSIVFGENGFLLFDNTIADKNYSFAIELVRHQYSSNTKSIIKGIGIITCLYVNYESNWFWLNYYQIFCPVCKLDFICAKWPHYAKLPFRTVLIDLWYAATELMLHFEHSSKIYYCPIKDNRLVDEGLAKL